MNSTDSSSFSHVFDGIDETGILFVVTINGALVLLSLLVCCVRHRHSHESVLSVLRLSDHAVVQRAGTDGFLYLKFFKGVGLLHALVALLACGALLPLHMFVGDVSATGVRRTSSANVPEDATAWLWVHVLVVFLVSAATYLFAFRFRNLRRETLNEQRNAALSITLDSVWIRGLPRIGDVTDESVRAWFAKRWPELRVRDLQVVSDTRELASLYDRYERARKSGSHLAASEQARLELQLRHKLGAGLRSAGHAFVRFHDRQLALDFLRHHWAERVQCADAAAADDADGRALGVRRWTLHEATTPGNVLWENLDVSRAEHIVRLVAVNVLICVLAAFFTTPTAIWSGLTSINAVAEWLQDWEKASSRSSLVFEYAPSAISALMSMILPYLVLLSTVIEKHRTKSSQENVRLRKTFIFLVFYGLMLPSAALTSVTAFVRFLSSDPSSLATIFPPDQGVFFLNYVVHVAFLFLAFDLARPHEWTRVPSAHFDFGLNLSWNLLLFLITLVYSTVFPLISVAGLVCFMMRFAVDKYQLCSVRVKQFDSNVSIVNTATYYVVFSVVIYQLAAVILCYNHKATAQLWVVSCFLGFLGVYIGWLVFRWRRVQISERKRRDELLANWHFELQDKVDDDGDDVRIYENPVILKVTQLLQSLDDAQAPGAVELENEEA
jgi:hypothetical protein